MPKRFAATENAIEKGLDQATPASGAKLAHDWAAELEKADVTGAKGVHADLERLAKELEKDEPKTETIQKILGKLGPATVKLADKCEDEKVAEKVRSLGEALQGHGIESDDEE
jgi:hypothetical protein